MTKVRTTINPDAVIDVDDVELNTLEQYGIIDSREGDEGWIGDEPTDVDEQLLDGDDEKTEGTEPEVTDTTTSPDAVDEPQLGILDDTASAVTEGTEPAAKSRKGR